MKIRTPVKERTCTARSKFLGDSNPLECDVSKVRISEAAGSGPEQDRKWLKSREPIGSRAAFAERIALTITRTAAASVFFPCRKRQLRPSVCSLEYCVSPTMALLQNVTGRPGTFMSVTATA